MDDNSIGKHAFRLLKNYLSVSNTPADEFIDPVNSDWDNLTPRQQQSFKYMAKTLMGNINDKLKRVIEHYDILDRAFKENSKHIPEPKPDEVVKSLQILAERRQQVWIEIRNLILLGESDVIQ